MCVGRVLGTYMIPLIVRSANSATQSTRNKHLFRCLKSVLHGNMRRVGIFTLTTVLDQLTSHQLASWGEADELASANPQHITDASHHRKHWYTKCLGEQEQEGMQVAQQWYPGWATVGATDCAVNTETRSNGLPATVQHQQSPQPGYLVLLPPVNSRPGTDSHTSCLENPLFVNKSISASV
jgi:hypothetical protein